MKYMITWRERSMGSGADYEGTQHRMLSVFKQWKFPESIKVLQFLVRVGEWGGFLLVESTDLLAIQKLTTVFPAFTFEVDACVEVQDAVTAELEGMAWRDSLKLN